MEEWSWAVKNGDLDDVMKPVEEMKVDVNAFADEKNGRYPLHLAADFGQTAVIKYLISKGAKVNVADKYNVTPLLAAIYEGHLETVKVLLENGADKSGVAPDGSKYIDCAEDDTMKALLQ